MVNKLLIFLKIIVVLFFFIFYSCENHKSEKKVEMVKKAEEKEAEKTKRVFVETNSITQTYEQKSKFMDTIKNKNQIEGILQRHYNNKIYLIPDSDPFKSIHIKDTNNITDKFLDIPTKIKVKISKDQYEIESITPMAIINWSKNYELLPEKDYKKLHSLFKQLKVKTEYKVSPFKEDKYYRELLNLSEQTINQIIKDYIKTDSEQKKKQEVLVESYRDIKRQIETYSRKANYIKMDNYIPEVYDQIFQNSKGSVAIFNRDEATPECSGVLVADNIILTCAHCLRSLNATINRCVVKFNYEKKFDGQIMQTVSFSIKRVISVGSSYPDATGPELDYAMLEINKDSDGKSAGDMWPIQTLSSKLNIKKDDAIYVIGYPKGNAKIIHDNAFVYWPFEVNKYGYNYLELNIKSEFTDDQYNSVRYLEEFRKSYIPFKLDTGEIIYRNYSKKWGGMPTIGADSDTFMGNSGSPVYLRRHQGVIGILFAGALDSSEVYKPGWRYHEAILPIKVIIEDLDRSVPEWRSWEGLHIE